MNSNDIRTSFLDFFRSKQHEIVPSAPMVVKNDPTLMFTNAGMNPFKEIFLGNAPMKFPRIADSQKCLRVSGKHNDLEEVGKDTYHHTMFEMLGNWSFGDYFKKEAIEWAWEFLTNVLKLDKNRLYATIFEGDQGDKTEADIEAKNYWLEILPESHIIFGNKKDNFWEMGDTGPCGPCSEIHVDLRSEEEHQIVDGATLINKDHPLVVEIWNLVFIQFNRVASGELQPLANKHVDTGMGFERLCMAVQGKKSNYDTDIFQPLIQRIATLSGKKYGENEEVDIAQRVIADHLRAVSFAMADGQLPSNNGAGYVIRRILRRAIRYGFTFLNFNEPFIYKLVNDLSLQMGKQYPELKAQQQLIEKVIQEEENSFLRTLANGINKFENYVEKTVQGKVIDGDFAFELFDTYGFPIDLTQLMASEKGFTVDMEDFHKGLEAQKMRSRAAGTMQTGDWVELIPHFMEGEFVGYSQLECEAKIVKYRKVQSKGKDFFQIVLNETPFYAESGGQVGDTGWLESVNEKVIIENTVKENNLTVHITKKMPENVKTTFVAKVNVANRIATQNNHSATHLIHYALRKVLGTHVEQKGSLVTPERLRFDFSHFSKVTSEEIQKVENMVNDLVRSNVNLQEFNHTPIAEAREMGAIALFGEKYGDEVRVIRFGDSVELCGGTHTSATGNIGLVKITSEGAIAAGIRRIEAVTGKEGENYVNHFISMVEDLKELFKSSNLFQAIQKMMEDNDKVKKEVENFQKERVALFVSELENELPQTDGIRTISKTATMLPEVLKQTAWQLRTKFDNIAIIFGSDMDDKANIIVAFSEDLVAKGYNAAAMVKEISLIIQGGGGGQPGLAAAGGKNYQNVEDAVNKIVERINRE
ncbi:MAG: alanine--tRNA ligase [Bacteroidales bacterium]|jgi:alanyl-tRNA synthetase|nr:alanine--tRNA ligase [Bacteroidales bacterium]